MSLSTVSLADLQQVKRMMAGTVIGMLMDFEGGELTSPRQGYFVGPLNSDQMVQPIQVGESWRFQVQGIGTYPTSYYVDDSPEEFIEKYHQILEDLDETVIVFFTQFSRSTEPAEGGWRWHKWGEYIGKHEPKHEYLHDEEDIEQIFVVKIVPVQY